MTAECNLYICGQYYKTIKRNPAIKEISLAVEMDDGKTIFHNSMRIAVFKNTGYLINHQYECNDEDMKHLLIKENSIN